MDTLGVWAGTQQENVRNKDILPLPDGTTIPPMTSSPPITIQEIRLFLIGLIFLNEESLLKHISRVFCRSANGKRYFRFGFLLIFSSLIKSSNRDVSSGSNIHPFSVMIGPAFIINDLNFL